MLEKKEKTSKNIIVLILLLFAISLGGYVLFSNNNIKNQSDDQSDSANRTDVQNDGNFVSDFFSPRTKNTERVDADIEEVDYFRNLSVTPTRQPVNLNSEQSEVIENPCSIAGVAVEEGTVISGETCVVENNL